MKPLFLLLALVPSVSFAGSLQCSSSRLSYAYDSTDGGAPRGPIISLKLDGKTLVSVEPFGPEVPLQLASFELKGKPMVLKVEKTRDYITTTYRQAAQVVSLSAEPGLNPVLFYGRVLCKSARYVGPPRP